MITTSYPLSLIEPPALGFFLKEVQERATIFLRGSYVGTGINSKIIDIEQNPSILVVIRATGAGAFPIVKIAGVESSVNFSSGEWISNGILEFRNKSFTLGVNTLVNQSGVQYIYFGWG